MAAYPADYQYPSAGGQSPRGQPSSQHGGRGFDSQLPRSISCANLKDRIAQCKDIIVRDLVTKPPRGGITFFTSTPQYTLTLPSFGNDPGFGKFVYDTLTDRPMQKHLVKDGFILNWCDTVSEVLPMNTLRDGNCLLHAASLGMWGFQDRDLTLRQALRAALYDVTENTLYQRWKHNREVENKRVGLMLEPHQWDEEWQMMVRHTSAKVLTGTNYDSLDDFHIFVLANVLRRPIILYSASKIHSMQTGGTLQEINFQGVYLPLLWEPATCKKNPLPLAYDGGHFCALAFPETARRYKDGQFLLPLVDYYGKQLAIRFSLPVEDASSLVLDYLCPIQVGHSGSAYITTTHIVCAKLEIVPPPAYLKSLVSKFVETCWDVYAPSRKARGGGVPLQGPVAESGGAGGERTKCINSCGRYGDAQHAFMCVECFRKAAEHEIESGVNRSPPRRNSREQPGGSNRWGEVGVQSSRDPPPPSVQGGGGSLGTVKCPQCAEPGMPQLLGMCQRCYGNTSTGGKRESIYERLPSENASQGSPGESREPPAVPLPRDPKERSLCRKPGCKYYGSVENRFYCSGCFNRDMENILKEVDQGPPIRPKTPSPTHAESGYQPQGYHQPSASGADPPMCYQCHDFYADEEYNGLCNGCFMKYTTMGGPPPQKPQDSGRRLSREAESQPSRRPDGQERVYNNSTAPKPYNPNYGDSTHQGASRSSRAPNPTVPVTTLESEVADMTMRDRCFMCLGGQLGASSHFTVCRHHAMDLFKVIQQGGKEEVRRESEVRQKPPQALYEAPQPARQYETPPSQPRGEPYEVPQSFGNEVRSKSYDTMRNEGVRKTSSSFRGNDLDNPHPGGRGANVAAPHSPDYDLYRDDRRGRQPFGNERGYPPQQSPGYGNDQQPRFGNEQGWPQPSGQFEQPPGSRDPSARVYGNELDYPPRQGYRGEHGYRGEQGRQQSNDFDAKRGQGDPRREASVHQRQPQGAEGGAVGASSPAAKPKVKALCARTGCSFKGYEPLKGLCPDCYIEEYHTYPDYYSPDEFPLI